ncbi:AraC family transcriptional regulator [Bacillus inaquosorum]|uniref:AraC/XylS family transcriptional regulator n=2 Tax=Bacillus inaquosorum TaxID=483913 RepID=A0A9W5LJY0_9BACI|nr:AraC family transcriptional regulator [Bacillus inaquosorum]AWM17741.1 AraC family transcriptional regulator [Bacillus inaquosorum]ELS62096.1 putative AraC/XylS family transcriptional regulator [Bacillus inaquosorum KCTC 13429]MCY9014011.1 AraC family transcriptional regulator [Bacillus inaquosorum]MCY9094920.1 AraC family transcriptional regulator [Bacillus inaquosorum]MCY9103820.1 AraC family transcriptional regulator [Bacillus inaquosorum]
MKSFMIDQNLKELTEHRTVELPVACYETRINQNINGYIPLHWHDEIQFVLIRKGEAVFQINEEKIVVPEGDGLFINSGCLHMAEEKDGSDCTYICLNVSPHFVLSQELFSSYVQPYIFSTNLSYLFLDRNQHWAKNILKAVKTINQLVQQKKSLYEIDITMQLTLMWKNLIFNGFQLEYDQSEMIKSHRMKQMLNWIHLHYAEKITLEDIAKAGQLSRSECCRYFKRMLNKTPLRYVLDYRIQKSLLLLQHPETNVTEVSYQVGFNSTSYFISKFQQAMNMTPFSYKKIHMGIN